MTDTSVEALRFRATVRHDGAEVGDLPYLEEFWAVRASDYATLLAERDRYKERAERAEAALRGISEGERFHLNGLEKWHRCQDIATDTLALIDAEPAEPRQPTVQEAARVLLGGFESPLLVALDPFNNSVDVAEDVLAALRALAEGDNQ